MTKQICVYFIIIIILFLYSCSSEISRKDYEITDLDELLIQDLNLNVNEIYSWVNLMPGSESRFHITGDIDLLESIKYDIKFVKLVSVIIYHNNIEIYRISPVIQEDDTEETSSKNIKFSTIKGLLFNRELNIDQNINIDLVFNEGSSELIYKLDNIKINKAY